MLWRLPQLGWCYCCYCWARPLRPRRFVVRACRGLCLHAQRWRVPPAAGHGMQGAAAGCVLQVVLQAVPQTVPQAVLLAVLPAALVTVQQAVAQSALRAAAPAAVLVQRPAPPHP